MSWSGYRPSDDPQVFGYNVPVNMYAAGALQRAVTLNDRVWRSASLGERAARLAAEIRQGIDTWGAVETQDGVRVYAYEVSLHVSFKSGCEQCSRTCANHSKTLQVVEKDA